MKNVKRILNIGAIAGLAMMLTNAASAKDTIPSGWMKSGNNVDGYLITIDRSEAYTGNQSVKISSLDTNTDVKGNAALMQFSNVEDFKGKRLMVSFYIKGEPINNGTGLLVQTYDSSGNIAERASDMFWNGENSKDISTWTESSVVMDIPESTSKIAYGGFLSGQGKIWFDNIRLDIVSDDVPLTNQGEGDE